MWWGREGAPWCRTSRILLTVPTLASVSPMSQHQLGWEGGSLLLMVLMCRGGACARRCVTMRSAGG